MESDDFKTALEVALQFFPGIQLKRENRNCASKALLLNEKTSSSGFCRLGVKGHMISNGHSFAIADHMSQTGHRIKWDHFDILATEQYDIHCKLRKPC